MSRAGAHAAATEAQSKRALRQLEELKWDKRYFEQAVRVELCRWAIPDLAGYPEDATPVDLVKRHLLSEFDKDWKPSEEEANELKRTMRQMVMLLEGHPRPFNRLETVRLMGTICREQLEQLDRPWSKMSERTTLSQLEKELAVWPSGMMPSIVTMAGFPDDDPLPKLGDNEVLRARDAVRKVDNLFGKYLVGVQFGFLTYTMQPRTQTQVEANRLRIAFACFERTHGRLPASLEELVPAGLMSSLSNDPFDDKPFGYSPVDRMFWSAGASGVNKSTAPDVSGDDDEDFQLAWRIPSL